MYFDAAVVYCHQLFNRAKILVHMGRDVNSDKSCMRKNGQNCTLWARDVRMLGQNGRRVDLHRSTVQRRKIVQWAD